MLGKIEREYGIKVLQSKKVRDVYRLKVRHFETLCLKKYDEPEPEVAFINRVLHYLRQSGFVYGPQLMLTRSHQGLVGRGAYQYVLTNWVIGRTPNFHRPSEWRSTIRRLAKFHSHAQGFPLSDAPSERIRYDHLGEMIQGFKLTVMANDSMERFEALCDQANEWLSQENCVKAIEMERAAGAFTHGDYNYPNLVIDRSKKIHLIDFENSSLQARMTDLAHILHRNYAWQGGGMLRAIEMYDQRRTLSLQDRHLLYALLLLPYPLVRMLRLQKRVIRHKGMLPSIEEIEQYSRRLQQLL